MTRYDFVKQNGFFREQKAHGRSWNVSRDLRREQRMMAFARRGKKRNFFPLLSVIVSDCCAHARRIHTASASVVTRTRTLMKNGSCAKGTGLASSDAVRAVHCVSREFSLNTLARRPRRALRGRAGTMVGFSDDYFLFFFVFFFFNALRSDFRLM